MPTRGRRPHVSRSKEPALTPFARALDRLRLERGFATSTQFAEALGVPLQTVSRWVRRGELPQAAQLDLILRTLQPRDEALEALVTLWEQRRAEVRAAASRAAVRSARRQRLTDPSLIWQWAADVADARGISLITLTEQVGLRQLRRLRRNGQRPSLWTLAWLLEAAPERLELTAEEQGRLGEAVATTIAAAAEQGTPLRVSGSPLHAARRRQC